MHQRNLRGLLAAVAIAIVATIAPASASATHSATQPIHPGVMTFTDGAQCTSNFIFRDGGGTYIGHAAHCSGTGGATETNGCDSGSLPIGSQVEVDGATRPGTMVYNSWLTMQAVGETDQNACDYNDFALVKIDPADVGRVNPTVPGYGGPTALGPSTAMVGQTVYSYQNSSLRGGASKLSPKQGTVLAGEGDGWSRTVYTATPGVPGDSGSGYMSDTGQAIGVLATVHVAPTAGANGVGDLRHELDYAHANSSFSGVALVPGTQPFNPNWIGAIIGA